MKRLWKNRGGFTLVEIIVTFTLTAIFMSSAALVLSTFMRSHTIASAVATEQDVASIVMDTVTSNLSKARYRNSIFKAGDGVAPEGDVPPSVTNDDKCSFLIDNSGANSVIWYVDGETENVVKMYRKEDDGQGYLALDYFIEPEVGETGKWTKTQWQLGTGVYQRCSLKSFKVGKIGDTSCLSIALTLENGIAGADNSFTIKRAIDCFNLASVNMEEKKSAG